MATDRRSIKNEDQYKALREQGMGKEKAARIANTPNSGEKGGKASPYEERTKQELYNQAKEIGIENYSTMTSRSL